MSAEPKCGFVVWNPFQVRQFSSVYKQFKDAQFLVVNQPYNGDILRDPFVASSGFRFSRIEKAEVPLVDGLFDVLFFQSPFPSIEDVTETHLVSLQYGLAKERHNYGEWRALADLNCMYGEYSCRRVAHFSPAVAVGNPKFDDWASYSTPGYEPVEEVRRALDPNRPTVLYMPTWGELGSFDDLLEDVAALQLQYNVIVKVHHNDGRQGSELIRARADEVGIQHLYEGSADQLALLQASDVVISDFSGAIFDATLARIPVVLYQPDPEAKRGVQKFDLESLEFARRRDLGLVCEDASALGETVDRAVAEASELLARVEPLRKDLFVVDEEGSAAARVRSAVLGMLAGDTGELSRGQLYTRETVREVRRLRKGRKGSRKKSGKGARTKGLTVDTPVAALSAAVAMAVLPPRLQRKFTKDPQAFFRDSRNPLVKRIGDAMGYPSK